MALSFNRLLGQPFAPAVQRELRKRRSLDQRYETSPTLNNPYFKLRRIESMSGRRELDRDRKTKDNVKFWELNKLSKQGLKDIEEKVRNGGNVKAPVGITDVSIEVKDYTFHTLEVNFVIPDVNDWEAFKEAWLVFGAPVEYEFGRKSLVEIEDNEDITPAREIREGLVANFSWSMGEQNRTITGSLTIFSSTYVELTKMAHSAKYDGVNISATFREEMSNLQMKDSTLNNIKALHGDVRNPNTGTLDFATLDEDDDIDQKFLQKSKYFYCIMNKNDYGNRLARLERKYRESNSDPSEYIKQQLYTAREVTQIAFPPEFINKSLPFGSEIINREEDDILFEFQERLKEQPDPADYNLADQEQINYVRSNVPFVRDSGQQATDFRQWFREQRQNGNEDLPTALPSFFYNFGQAYVDWANDSYELRRQLNDKANNISNTDIQKYAISELSLENSTQNEFDADVYFYVSMRFIGDIINWIIKYNNDILDEELLSEINLLDVKIRDLSVLGLGSSEPDKVMINPWNRKYSINEDHDPLTNSENLIDTRKIDETNKEFILDPKGEYTLLEDVFLSAPIVLEIAKGSDSPLEFVERIVDEIENATRGLLRLQKIEKNVVHKDKFQGKAITYFDVSTIRDQGNGEKTYHQFNLFDYREKIRDIDVNSDLSDDFSQYAYFRSLNKIEDVEDAFYYDNQYYNNDGTVIDNELSIANTYAISEKERRRIEQKYGIGQSNAGSRIFDSTFDTTPSPLKREDSTDGFEAMVSQYMMNGQELIDSYQALFNDLLKSNKERLGTFLQSRDTTSFEADSTVALLTYIEAYFTVLTDVYKLVYNPFDKQDSTTTIPLKVDLTLDGISGIVTGQVFKIDLSSFPMAYNISNTSPLFVVSTLGHSFTENNDWSTTIGGFLYIPAQASRDAIYGSDNLRALVDSKNARLQMVSDIFKTKISEILSGNNE